MSKAIPPMRCLTGLESYVLLGAFGWCVEIIFTSVMDCLVLQIAKDPWKLEGNTYLWMHPIYGAGLYLGTSTIVPLVRDKTPLPLRMLLGVVLCFAIEYVAGWVLRASTGVCPWDYTQADWNVHGLIRLDYAPAWAVLSYLVEFLTDVLDSVRLVAPTREQQKTERKTS